VKWFFTFCANVVAFESLVHTEYVSVEYSLARIRFAASNLLARIRPFVYVVVSVTSFEVFCEMVGAGEVQPAHGTLKLGEMCIVAIRRTTPAGWPIVRTSALLKAMTYALHEPNSHFGRYSRAVEPEP
jgi:hypothetical protein